MPDNDELDRILSGDDGDAGTGDDAGDGSSTSSKADPKSPDKRISDLQGAKDKETARANKAEAALQKFLNAAKSEGTEEGKPAAPAAGGPAVDYALELARMFTFSSNPKLAQYDLTAADLTGSTPAEISKSASDLIARFEKVETKTRNKLLAEHGLAPEVDNGAPPPPARDFSKMSSEDFKKVMDEAMRR